MMTMTMMKMMPIRIMTMALMVVMTICHDDLGELAAEQNNMTMVTTICQSAIASDTYLVLA